MQQRTLRRRRGLGALAAFAVLAASLVASPAAAQPGNPLPVFEFGGIITDKDTMTFNPTDEYIFPSIFHAGAHFENPLAEWYLYFAPHDDPGGIALMYSDSLEGPWTEYAENPLIENEWQPHYNRVPHVSTPEVFWHPEEERLFLYFHGNNSTTRYAISDDGVTFEYGGIAVTNASGGTTETSYARVFEHPDETSAYRYAMFYMGNTAQNIRQIRLAESTNARDWVVRPTPLVIPGAVEGQNVSSADLWEWEGKLYVIYHASSGEIHARETNPSFTELGPTLALHRASGVGADSGRVAAPNIVTHEGETYLFYEAGDRLGGTIAWAKLNPELVREEPVVHPDPLWAECPGVGSDEFNGEALDRSLWPHIVRESGARHELVDGALVIPTYNAGINAAPLVQQDLPSGAWEATTELSVAPRAAFQQAGLLVYRDDSNYAKFDLLYGSNGLRLEFIWRQNGSDRNTGADSVAPSAALQESLWLRLTSDGTNLSASVSYDGTNFTSFGRTVPVATLQADRIGPYAIKGVNAAPEITAAFDWFRWTPSQAEQDACAAAPEEPGEPGEPGGPGEPGAPGEPGGPGEPVDPGADATATVSKDRVAVGGTLDIAGANFAPGEPVEVWVYSDPVLVRTVTASATGAISTVIAIPVSVDPGLHRVRLLGLESGAEAFSAEFTVTGAAAGPAASVLASTGTSLGALWLALLLLGGGIVATRLRKA